MKNFKLMVLFLLLSFIFAGLFFLESPQKSDNQKPIVMVSTFALYDVSKFIADDTFIIKNILPFGVDPHSFELTPKIMASIEKSSVVFYSGAGLEPWISKINFKSRTVNMSQYITLRKVSSDTHHHEDEHHHHGGLDPHYWLDVHNMQKIAQKIADEFIKLEPKNSDLYVKKRDAYIAMLQTLDAAYKKELASCKIDTVILNHNSLGYIAQRYHFHSEALSGLSPESVPTPSDIKRILQEISKDGVETIFYENFVTARVVNTIANDAGVKVEVIQTLANITADQAKQGSTYEALMQENLEKISKAMQCN